mmetsp:Transcript_116634/g.341385  ORF Transcript_116634/g.341385 Transcript_116634/m.341385 type:complete len:596 (+) Transcript_116634:89-1876(+)
MIIYESAKLHPIRLVQISGSVMPFSFCVALPCALLTVLLKLLPTYVPAEGTWDLLSMEESVKEQIGSAAFSGMNFLIGFLVVFRSSQAYNRFWEGLSAINSMQGEWWDAASSLVAFCKCAKAPFEEIILFQHTLLRLISMLNGCVLMELSAGFHRDEYEKQDISKRAFELELIDAEGIDSESLYCLNMQAEKVELIFQWIQQLVVEADCKDVFSVSDPILSRAFQELSNGMVQYRQASKIARTPLPFPYMQATELLLVSHWLCTPVLMCAWVESPLWAGILCFIQVLFYWSLNSIATELENPFGEDANDLPAKEIQQDFNKRLLLLIRPGTVRTAHLSKQAAFEETRDAKETGLSLGKRVLLSQDGVKNQGAAEQGRPRRGSLESNKITWGTLRTSIEEKWREGFVSEADSNGGRSRSRSLSKTRTRSPRGGGAAEEPKAQLLRAASATELLRATSAWRAGGSKDLPPFAHPSDFADIVEHERLGRHLACLASLPELLTVCTDVRDQLKSAVATEEVVSESEEAAMGKEEATEVPRRGGRMRAVDEYGEGGGDVPAEAPLLTEPVHRRAGKPLSDGGCLGFNGCGRGADQKNSLV